MDERAIGLVAASVDSEEDTRELIDSLGITFSMGYGLDYLEFAAKTGAFYEIRREIIHATGFILRQDGTVATSGFASGPIGRLWVDDCLRVIDFYRR